MSDGVLRPDGDRRGVRFERRLEASPTEVWAALTEPAQLRGWLAPTPVFEARVGGEVRIDFGGGEEVTGTVLVFEPPRLLEYEWHFTGESESVVRFELLAAGEGTLLVLDHRRLDRDQATGYGAGWHAHLDQLGAVVEGREPPDWQARFDAVLGGYRELASGLG